ncbi:MAG TPA: TetR/AcrR family transcriptional regulator [Phenylobacterium sp.]|jgi:AcrR family transcriptional regulator
MQLTKTRLDRDQRRERILDVAQEVFLEEGFANASMSTIAARLGGSKGTLYNYFKSKDELFRAYVERRCLWQQDEVFATKAGEVPEAALHRIARSFLAHVLNEVTLRNFALIVAEAERTPEIGRIFYETGPRQGTERLASFIAGLDAAGVLDVDGDPVGAAQHFLGLLQSPTFKGRLCNAIPPLTPEQVDAEAVRGVKTFLRAFCKRP